jgi:hypothetical protein
LLFQLIAKHRDAFESAFEHAPDKDTDVASKTEVSDVFSAIVRKIPHCTLVIDGLDESAPAGDKRKQFLVELKCAVVQTATRILVVSRDEVDIRSELAPPKSLDGAPCPKTVTTVELRVAEDDVRDDIIRFTRSVVKQRLPHKPEALRHDLAAQLADKCHGMFLWVNLQKDELSRGLNRKKLELAVQTMALGPRTGVRA